MPTDTGRSGFEAPRRSGADDVEARKADLQRALGPGFEVRQPVGRGGFGEVWEAFDTHLSRAVAVKVLRPELSASEEFRERFRREARAIAQLRHAGIVPIYHVGEALGLVYFIMPLVEGITLTTALGEAGGLPAEEAVRILVEAATALREAHAHGIVHRDLKPENFMLEGPQRRVLLMDFGIAKVEGPETEGLTDTGMVFGSPEYMSPEQATGRRLDARSDIYSLGVVAYRMLAGKLPFDADTPREVLAHHVLSPPEPLDSHVALPSALNDAVMRCLAKSPDERWQTIDAFLGAISGAAPPVPAPGVFRTRAERPLARAPRPERRRWTLVTSVALLSVVAALAVLAPWLIARSQRHQRGVAAALGVVALYREAGDSLRSVARAFVRGDTSGAQYLAAQESLQLQADARIDEAFGAALDDSAQWSETPRRAVQVAAEQFAAAGLDGSRHSLLPSEVAGCRLSARPATTTVRDAAPRDNCWWQASGTGRLASPAEYFVEFRVTEALRPDAGLGLAWCTHAADCRVVFLWSANAVVWASHLPQTGLQALQSGRRITLPVGTHRLRIRDQEGMVRVWLDQRVVLERDAGREAAYLERPGSIHVVVQNAAIAFPGKEPLGAVGVRRSGLE